MSNALRRSRSQAVVGAAARAKQMEQSMEAGEQENTEIKTRNFALAGITYPVTVLRFSKMDGNTAHEVVTFENAKQLTEWLAMSMGAVRIVPDVKDVPTQTLLAIYNRTRGDSPLDRFRDRHTAEARTAEVLPGLAVKFQESDMAKAKEATGQTATEAKAEERKAAKAKREAEKAAAKEAKAKESAERRAGGVIGTIRSMLDTKTGATQAEILDALVAKFPDRTRDGMSSTVKIQCSRLAKTLNRTIITKEVVDRGRVYKFEDKGPIPGKEVVKAAPAAEAPKARKGKPAAAAAAAQEPATAGA